MSLTLSENKKEEVMSNYSRIAWYTVHRYRKSKRLSREDTQDLHQECMVKLIEHFNKCETEDELYELQIMNLVNVMTKYLMRGCTFTGTQSTEYFRKLISSQPEAVSMSALLDFEVADQSEGRTHFEDQIITKIDLERFMETLTGKQRTILIDKFCGYKNSEIAEREKVERPVISMQMKAIQKKFEKYNSEGDS